VLNTILIKECVLDMINILFKIPARSPTQRHVTNRPRRVRTGSVKLRPVPGRAPARATCSPAHRTSTHRTGLNRYSQKLPPSASYTGLRDPTAYTHRSHRSREGTQPPPPDLAIKAGINNRAGIFKMFGCDNV